MQLIKIDEDFGLGEYWLIRKERKIKKKEEID